MAKTGTPALEGTDWRLVRLGDTAVEPGPDAQRAPSLRLDREGTRAYGSGGCNRFTGGYTLAGPALRFTPLAATKMACPDMATEDAYFAALARTEGWRLAENRLELLDAEGAVLATFTAAPAR